MTQRMLELAEPVGGVHVDEDGADLRRRVLRDHPLDAVRAPDADAVATFDAGCQQPAGDALHFETQLAVGEALVLVAGDERLPIGKERGGAIEALAERLAEQRQVRRTAHVGAHERADYR